MTVRVADACAGMELIQPVRTLRGITLFNTGITLTEKHIKALKAWGITEIEIKGENDTASPSRRNLDDSSRNEVIGEVDFIFQKADMTKPLVRELYELAIKHKIKRKSQCDERSVELNSANGEHSQPTQYFPEDNGSN